MLRLWPDHLVAGIYPGSTWLEVPGKLPVFEHTFKMPAGAAGWDQSILDAFGQTLEANRSWLKRGTKLSLSVSETLAATVVLPWQEQLSKPAEIRAYAMACLEEQGFDIRNNWVMHSEFRHHGALGLAYALPSEGIDSVSKIIVKHGLQLNRILPSTAWAYWKTVMPSKGIRKLVLLDEHLCSTAMTFTKAGLEKFDVEASTIDSNIALKRLLSRVDCYSTEIRDVTIYLNGNGDKITPQTAVSEYLPNAKVAQASPLAWR